MSRQTYISHQSEIDLKNTICFFLFQNSHHLKKTWESMGAVQLLFVGCLCFVNATLAANLLEPEFLSPATMWRTVGTNPRLATSPFYTNEAAISHLVHQLLTVQQDDKALLFMKKQVSCHLKM